MTTATPSAGAVTVGETLKNLQTAHASFFRGVAEGRYTLWLGSGISRERFPDLGSLIKKVLIFLHECIAAGDPGGAHRAALDHIVGLARLRPDELAKVSLDEDPRIWPVFETVVDGLWHQYAEMLGTEVEGQKMDYLVWDAVDVRATYGGATEPDCEHLCIAVLSLEGVISHAVSANWDGLIETALEELTGYSDVVQVVVLPTELRAAEQSLTLIKFHGCAVLAALDEAAYRKTIIASRPQITAWSSDSSVAAIRAKMASLAAEQPTLMIGLSAQDEDIQSLFAQSKQLMSWPWPSDPPAHVFSGEQLGADHVNILRVVYGDDYEHNSSDIRAQALIRAYGKPLLTALMLGVLGAKFHAYLLAISAPNLTETDRATLGEGLSTLAALIATCAEPDRLVFVRSLIAHLSRTMLLFQGGDRSMPASTRYTPLSPLPAHRIRSEPSLTTNGMRELAAALAVLGRGLADGSWLLDRGPTPSGAQGAVRVTATGLETAVFFAANGKAAAMMVTSADVDPSDASVLMVHSTAPVSSSVRSPRASYGRTGRGGMRQIDMGTLLRDASDIDQLESSFRVAASL